MVAVPVLPDNYLGQRMRLLGQGARIAEVDIQNLSAAAQVARIMWGAQAAWFIDPANSTGLASDSNVGDTATNPLLTLREFAYRINLPTVATTASLATLMSEPPDPVADSFLYDYAYGGPSGFPAGCTLDGTAATTLLDSTTLTGVVSQVVGTRTYEQITAGGFDWTPYVDQRVRIAAGGTPGAVSWVLALGGAVDTAIVRRPTTFGVPTNFAVSDDVVVEQLPIINVGGHGVTSLFDDFAMGVRSCEVRSDYNQCGLVLWDRSKIVSVQYVCPDVGFVVDSYLQPGIIEAGPELSISGGCVVRNAEFRGGTIVQGGDVMIKGRLRFSVGPVGWRSAGPLGFQGWTTSALEISGGSTLEGQSGGTLWGQSATAGTYGVNVFSGGLLTYFTKPDIIGALSPGQDVRIGGVPLAYAAVPNVNAANLAAMVVRAT